MKKILAAAILALVSGTVFAQAGGPAWQGGPGAGHMGGWGIDWKIGTVVTGEYKKATGTLTIGQTLAPTFATDGVTYSLWLPQIPELAALKTGSTVTVEGVFTTIRSDTPVPAFVRAFKITYNGKEYAVYGPGMMGGHGMMRGPGPRL